jgi:hypothetical protein
MQGVHLNAIVSGNHLDTIQMNEITGRKNDSPNISRKGAVLGPDTPYISTARTG